jgi:hypothetical protein|tara:strand:+ start:421 stop:630 length:210 start_codon:yes stop_codon:yes gene_type:complete
MPITNKQIHDELRDLKEDVRFIKKKLLDPDDGTIARVNRNTSFRKSTQKTLWSVWVAILGIIGTLIFWD